MMADNLILDSNDRKYFSIIPNLVDDDGLSPFAFRLYCHIKRVAGENGQCWQSARTLAENCEMSVFAVSQAKRELVEHGLIEIESLKSKHGGHDYHQVTIKDIWQKNLEHAQKQGIVDNWQDSQKILQGIDTHTKKNPRRKTQEEEIKQSPSETKSPKKPYKPSSDPLLLNPAVIKYRDLARTTPNDEQRRLVAKQVEDLKLWGETITHWKGHGWNKRNIIGILGMYNAGGPATCSLCKNGGGKSSKYDQTTDIILNALKKEEAKSGTNK